MKSLDILRSICVEAQSQLRASTSRDWISIQKRHKHEGDSFLGITLPLFAEWLETSIRDGEAAPWIRSKFRKKAGSKSVLPCFLHGLTALVFDAKTGRLRSNPDTNAVFFIRQICLFHKKMFFVCDAKRLQTSISTYVEVDLSLRRATLPVGPSLDDVSYLSDLLSADLEATYIAKCEDHTLKPRHGPGATADKQWANGKFRTREYLSRWSGLFSWEELYGLSTIHQSEDESVEPKDELPAKVVAVPKTMKTARIICVEPTAMQFAQQLVSNRLRAAFVDLGIDRQLNLRDQTVNQRLALEGSTNGRWATLDLSEASDRLHCKVVRQIFRKCPVLKSHIFGCRTSRARLPDGEILHLMKYASMGSALTFPIEAYCFYIIAASAVYREFCEQHLSVMAGKVGLSPVTRLYYARKALSLVFVFGDDIVVPNTSAQRVGAYLGKFFLKVNSKKSFEKGPFRESCGKDYMYGDLVTPTYLRFPAPASIRDAVNFTSWVEMSNRFHLSGLWRTSETIRKYLDTIQVLPMVSHRCEGLGYVHFTGAYSPSRWSKKTSGWVVRTVAKQSKRINDPLDGYDRLLANQIHANESEQRSLFPEAVEGSERYSTSPVRNSLRLRRKVVQP